VISVTLRLELLDPTDPATRGVHLQESADARDDPQSDLEQLFHVFTEPSSRGTATDMPGRSAAGPGDCARWETNEECEAAMKRIPGGGMAEGITRDSIIDDILDRFPEVGPILIQSRMFRAKPEPQADYPRTLGDYAALNGIELDSVLKRVRAAVEAAEFHRARSIGGRPPGDPMRRGALIGYTGAYREPGDVELQDVVTAQTTRGPE
jgi:hypothetical protein